jgi:hypothetical protein
MSADRITLELALHDASPNRSILVSKDGAPGNIVALQRSEIVWRALRQRWMTAPGGLRLQMLEVSMPRALANKRGLA